MKIAFLSFIMVLGSMAHSAEECHYYLPALSQEDVNQFMKHPPETAVLVCPEGTTIPIHLYVKGDLLELEESSLNAYRLRIKKTFYLRYTDDQFTISVDDRTWKKWDELLTGVLSARLNEGPLFELEAEMHIREGG